LVEADEIKLELEDDSGPFIDLDEARQVRYTKESWHVSAIIQKDDAVIQ
jgi:hypothetical protein